MVTGGNPSNDGLIQLGDQPAEGLAQHASRCLARAATVAFDVDVDVDVASAVAVGVPVDGDTSLVPKSEKEASAV